MMSGLRSHREYTITCVSLRSGIASSATERIEYQPAAASTATSRRMSTRLRPENSMIALIMVVFSAGRGCHRAHLTFAIQQEGAARDDPLPGLESTGDLDAVVDPCARYDLTRFEFARA